jgi:Tol biopolymer transport system component
VARAAVEASPRRFNPTMAILIAALLAAAMAGALAVGALADRDPAPLVVVGTENGLLVAHDTCGGIVGVEVSASPSAPRELAALADTCGPEGWPVEADMAWSADGRVMAYLAYTWCYACDRFSTFTIGDMGPWLYDAGTGETRHLAPCPEAFCTAIDISPDGSTVAYLATSDHAQHTLIVARVDGGASQHVTLFGQIRGPSFSPDGSHLAYSVIYNQTGIYTLDVSALGLDTLPEPTPIRPRVRAYSVSWAPNGTWLAYDTIGRDGVEIWLVRPDGSEPRVIASDPSQQVWGSPAWAPDSASIAFAIATFGAEPWPDRFELRTVGLGGGEPVRVREFPCCLSVGSPPAWSPDGTQIAVSIHDGRLYVVSPDGTRFRRVATLGTTPEWQPLPPDPPR